MSQETAQLALLFIPMVLTIAGLGIWLTSTEL